MRDLFLGLVWDNARSRVQVQDRSDTRQDYTDVLWTGFAGISNQRRNVIYTFRLNQKVE